MSDDKTEPVYIEGQARVLISEHPWIETITLEKGEGGWIDLGSAERVHINSVSPYLSEAWKDYYEDEAEVIPICGITFFERSFTFEISEADNPILWQALYGVRRASARIHRRASACHMALLRGVRKRSRFVRRNRHER